MCVYVCVLKFIKRNLGSKIFEAFCVLNLAVFFLARVEENVAVIYFLLPLRRAAGVGDSGVAGRGLQWR